ncbi:MAG: bifunctional UDP-N-acetylglucosamine diphosphorylase/glucosamine-1-phosphate N-acetyltransferase GlmU [Anaerolineales bacterium]|jgi:bifunctional UDP-N-acetylglucosamine pyrophosphorylase/glucosamine-1-phosphate N-acetyltransferase
MKITAILLAAGQGIRMNSDLPKVLHPVAGKPMLWHALKAVADVSTEKPVVVVGHQADAVRDYIGDNAHCIVQEKQLGTAHAVHQVKQFLKGKTDLVLVTYADMPLLGAHTLKELVDSQVGNKGPISLLTVISEDSHGFGRILRTEDGTVQAIVEEVVATPDQKKIKELNVGAYCFNSEWLWEALENIEVSPKGEYFLTDTVALAVNEGLPVKPLLMNDLTESIGVNTRIHLAEAESAMRNRINRQHMLSGVTMVDPLATFIDAGITIGRDTTIWPSTYLHGNTQIGERSEIGPGSVITDSLIGNGCKILYSVMEGAVLEDDVTMGPFARLRKGAHLCKGVHMGNFGEVKDSTLGEGTKMGHFSYIGNAKIGSNVNIGAGTITCNYDGEHKNETLIGEDAFIGSDTMLVAPLKIGKRSRTGAGSVVTKDVDDDTLVVGMPARAIKKLEKKKDE